MGIYDRDYYRQGRSGFRLRAPRSAVVAIILINVAVYVLETVDRVSSEGPAGRGSSVADFLAPHVNFDASRDVLPGRSLAWWEHDTLPRPWLWWQFLTCGFVHAPLDPQHIFFNMLMLFFLGRACRVVVRNAGVHPPVPDSARILLRGLGGSDPVFRSEARHFDWGLGSDYQRRRALRAELSQADRAFDVRASRAGLAPRRLLIGWDIWGAMHRGDNVAYTAHLGGAAFALLYFQYHWNLGQLFQSAGDLAERPIPALAQGLQTRK